MKIRNSIRAGAAALAFTAVSLASGPVQADHHAGAIEAALNHPDRPAEDRARDAQRKPAEVLEFAGVKPGMTVLDINSAGGYYTEILSRVVGPNGKVYAHNGAVYWAFMKRTEPLRYANNRLSNVTQIHEDQEVFNLNAGSIDFALAILAYHDYYFSHEARTGGGRENVPNVLTSLFSAMRQGGTVLIVDHIARDGSMADDFDKLHRIDPNLVRTQMEAAGFTFGGQSKILENDDDTLDKSPFDPSVRGKTSRFVYRFSKK